MKNAIELLGAKVIAVMVLFTLTFASYANNAIKPIFIDNKASNPRCAAASNGKSIVIYNKIKKYIFGKNRFLSYTLYDESNVDKIKQLDSGDIDPTTDIINPDVSIAQIEGKTIVVITYTELWAKDEIRCKVGIVNDKNKIEWGKKLNIGPADFSSVAINSKGDFIVVLQSCKKFHKNDLRNTYNLKLSYDIGTVDIKNKTIRGFNTKLNDLFSSNYIFFEKLLYEESYDQSIADVAISKDGEVMIVMNSFAYNEDSKALNWNMSFVLGSHVKNYRYYYANGNIMCLFSNFDKLELAKDEIFYEHGGLIQDMRLNTLYPCYSLDTFESGTINTDYDFTLGYNPVANEHELIRGNIKPIFYSWEDEDCSFNYNKPYQLNQFTGLANVAMCYLNSDLYFTVCQDKDEIYYALMGTFPSSKN